MAWTSFEWTAADGSIIELLDADNGLTVLAAEAGGLNAPPVNNVTAAVVALDGSLLVKRRRPERTFVLPLLIQDTDLQARVRTITSALQGPGTLTVSDGVVTRSLLTVYYQDGLEGSYGPDRYLPGAWQKFVVLLNALDPWWHGETNTATLGFGTEITFDDASTTFDDATAFNGSTITPLTVLGDTTALPAFTLDGPFTTCQIGIAGGQSFALAAALATGDTITVDTARGSRGPRLNGGSIDWSLLTSSSRLFEVPAGSTSIHVSATGTDGNSAAEMTYRHRWLTP